jgi:hypothetical protein
MHSIGIGVVVGELCGCELESQLIDVVPHFELGHGLRKKERLRWWLCEPVLKVLVVVVVVGCQREVIVEGHASLLALIPNDRV